MPVALKLSKRFYDVVGQEVADEFVDALNAVDVSYRAEFRELFGAHFGQLRAEMDKLASELRSDMDRLKADLRTDMRRMEARIDMQDERIEKFRAQLSGEIKGVKSELIGWLVGLWLASPLATVGIVLLLRQLRWL